MDVEERYSEPMKNHPVLEAVREEIFDTKELLPTGLSMLEFFYNPNQHGLTNMNANGQLMYPQMFFLFGLTLKIYSAFYHVDGSIKEAIDELDRFREILLANAIVQFHIGAKPYLEVPANAIVDGLVPEGVEKLSDTIFAIPEITEEDFENVSGCRPSTIPNGLPTFSKFELRKPEEPITGPVIERKPGVHFFNMSVYIKGKPKPLYIPCQQSFRGRMFWREGSPTFDDGLLGKVFVRMGLAGIKWREVQ